MTCRAPGGCPNFPECYAAKECLHEPDAYDAEQRPINLNYGNITSEGKFQLVYNGVVIGETTAPIVQAGETISVSFTWPIEGN